MPIQAILGGFYTTAVCNVVTWNKAYSLYPYFTFIRRRAYLLKPREEICDTHVQKYVERGWQNFDILTDEENEFYNSSTIQRYVGDSKTWKISLESTGLESSGPPDYVIENAHFTVNKELEWDPSYYVSAIPFQACVLKHTYTSSNTNGADFWWYYMMPTLDALTRAELEKMPVADQPDWFTRTNHPVTSHFLTYDGSFRKPDTWTYYDHLVPQWLEQWKVVRAEQDVLSPIGSTPPL